MNLISQIFFAILITSATGTIALGCWKAAKKLCLAWNPDVVHLTLKLVGVLYLIPFSYILMQSITPLYIILHPQIPHGESR